MYYCFIWNVKNIALKIHTVADRDTWKSLIFDLRLPKILKMEDEYHLLVTRTQVLQCYSNLAWRTNGQL